MVCLHVFRVRQTQLQILNAVVACVAIFVVYAFTVTQLPAQVLLHDVSVFKHSTAIDVDPHVPERGQTRFPFFGVRPVLGDVVRTVSEVSGPVFWANGPMSLAQHERASLDCTNMSLSHCRVSRVWFLPVRLL